MDKEFTYSGCFASILYLMLGGIIIGIPVIIIIGSLAWYLKLFCVVTCYFIILPKYYSIMPKVLEKFLR